MGRPDPGLGGNSFCPLCSAGVDFCLFHSPVNEYLLVRVSAEHKGLWWKTETVVDVNGDSFDGVEFAVERMQSAMVRNRIPVGTLEWTFYEQPSYL